MGLGATIGIQILLSISLVGCRGKSLAFAFLLRLAYRPFFRLNMRVRTVNTYITNIRLLKGTSLILLE